MSEERKPDRMIWAYPSLFAREAAWALAILCVLIAGGLALDLSLGRPAHPDVTPSLTQAPWFFLGYQELLQYFPAEFSGVGLPALSLIGLAIAPYVLCRVRRRGRRLVVALFVVGFLLWYGLIIVVRVCRGPFWTWQCF